MTIPSVPPDEAALEEQLSRPGAAVVEAMRALDGDLLILGAGGKMGPSLARLAQRALAASGSSRRVIAVARFSNSSLRAMLECNGVDTLECDLFDREKLAQLPEAPNVVYLVGQKFGTSDDAVRTWAVNAFLPGIVAERFAGARIVAFSTGNVYPLSPVEGDGSSETDPVGPVGEYAQSALARERVFEFFSRRHSTPMALLRLNYAIEPRYGVLRDLADRVWSQQSVDVTMGKVNLIWQRDANAIALRALTHCAVPPLVLNVTGRPAYPVRWLAQQLGKRWSRDVQFRGTEAATALLSDAARMEALFGKPETNIEAMLEQVAQWVERRGRSLGKPTHFEEREGRF
jgi:nucleoside-diphosphate-sugar epimerase